MRALLLVLVVACGGGDDDARPSDEAPDAPPRRVVSLTPSATEIVAALGADDRLVGVDDYSTYPESVRDLPRVGSFLNPSPEAILRLEPDLVIAAAAQPEAARGLASNGLEVLVLDIHDLDDVRAALGRVGAALGLEARGREAAGAMEQTLEQIRSRAGEQPGDPPSVLVAIDHDSESLSGLVAAGPGSYMDELVRLVGGRNALARSKAPYPKLSAEHVLRAAPEVILDTAAGSDDAARAVWSQMESIPAVKHGRVYSVAEPIFRAPSPRAPRAAARLEELIGRGGSP